MLIPKKPFLDPISFSIVRKKSLTSTVPVPLDHVVNEMPEQADSTRVELLVAMACEICSRERARNLLVDRRPRCSQESVWKWRYGKPTI